MKFSLLTKLFDSNEKEIKKLEPIITEINALEENIKKLKDKDFPKKTEELKERISSGESLDLILPEAFAIVREAAFRAIGLRLFDAQLMASIVLSAGKIAEQKTGEGKTLSAVPALYLNSLTNKNVHLVTVNDYLARRDAGWMGPVFSFLGVSVSAIINDKSFLFDPNFVNESAKDFRLVHLREISRKEAYETDVVYGINSEFGFDYLRDNMSQETSQIVQKGYYFAIVDEVDSVLIDEARTPHIISAAQEESTDKYYQYAKIVEKLTADTDFKVDEKFKTAHLTEAGILKIEKLFGITNIYEKDFNTVYHLEAALKAKTLFSREKDYIVRENEVILVDEFTGRLMVGRRLSEGLHQAIEAKENVPIQKESKTLATVSLQNYFRMYEKLAGMTGTAVTEAEEFNKIYKLDVVVIPTHRKIIRQDLSDVIYKTGGAKFNAVVAEIEKIHKTGQPILVGTTSIDKNEIISHLLQKKNIKHEVLNAKNHEREAEIIARAGEKNAITVATNMAGRGVDIILGGEAPKNEDGTINKNSSEWKTWEKKHKEVLDLGGLFILGTERHESRRIDNQLRGRSGRQGDPGSSQFFVALDDEIMRLFGGETIATMMTRFNMPEDMPLSHGLVSRAIEQAQVKVEGFNFDARKHLVDYDDVLNKQREIIYSKRNKMLLSLDKDSTFLKKDIFEKLNESITKIVLAYNDVALVSNINQQILSDFITIVPFDDVSQNQLLSQLEQFKSSNEKIHFLSHIAQDIYNHREKHLGEKGSREIERFVSLYAIDALWVDHLDAVDNLRQGIGLRGYGQKDPLVEYKNEAFGMFQKLISAIDDEIIHRIFKVNVQINPEVNQSPLSGAIENTPISEISVSPKIEVKEAKTIDKSKLSRNDPCWCGAIDPKTGKQYKYKKCGLINAPYHKG